MSESESIYQLVSSQYTAALQRAQARKGSACGPTCCTPATLSAGYGAEQGEFADAAEASFGCGNPLAFADVQAGQTVVDLGSGAGFDLLIAAQKVGPSGRVIGVDMTDAMIDAARTNAARAGASQVEVRKGKIENLPVADSRADWVISNCVINLSPEKTKVFAEIGRVLKPGGHFRVSDLVAGDLPEWVRQDAVAYASCVAGAIDEAAYVAGLRAAGLEDVTVVARHVYSAAEVKALVVHDFAGTGLDSGPWLERLHEIEGQVASITVTGHKPEKAVAKAGCCSCGGGGGGGGGCA